jgi:hypothetical protein
MIDIETLSTSKHAAVMAIGMCAFNLEHGVIDSEGYYIDPKHVYGHVDPKTVQWWMAQPEQVRERVFNGKHNPYQAAYGLLTFVQRHKAAAVWANSPTFDSVILKHWWEDMPGTANYPTVRDQPFPLVYKKERDVRTLRALALELGIEETPWQGDAHNPVDDCCNQARDVIHIRKEIRRRMG